MKKHIIALIMIVCVIVAILACYAADKTEWKDACEMYGPLNLMDDEIDSNNFESFYTINGRKDIKLVGNVLVRQGEIDITVECDGMDLLNESYASGQHELSSDIYNFDDGKEIKVTGIASDDVEGTYSIHIYTRETNISRWLNRIRDMLIN